MEASNGEEESNEEAKHRDGIEYHLHHQHGHLVCFILALCWGAPYAADTLATNLTLQKPTIKTSDTSAGTGRRMTEVIGTPNFPVFPGVQNTYYQFISSKLGEGLDIRSAYDALTSTLLLKS